jgi:hypothetical protein
MDAMPQGAKSHAQFEKSLERKQIIGRLRLGERPSSIDWQGKLSRNEMLNAVKEAQSSPFAASFKHLTLEQALNVYAISSDHERTQVALELSQKFHNTAKAMTTGKSGLSPERWQDVRELFQQLLPDLRAHAKPLGKAASRP